MMKVLYPLFMFKIHLWFDKCWIINLCEKFEKRIFPFRGSSWWKRNVNGWSWKWRRKGITWEQKKIKNKLHVNEKYLRRKFILLFPHVLKETREFPWTSFEDIYQAKCNYNNYLVVVEESNWKVCWFIYLVLAGFNAFFAVNILWNLLDIQTLKVPVTDSSFQLMG